MNNVVSIISAPKMGAQFSTLSYNGHLIRDQEEMVSLTDMWKASGCDPVRQPAKWLSSADATRFIDFLSDIFNLRNSEIAGSRVSHSGLISTVRGGKSPGTWAHWQVALAYAKYLSPEFHSWCNTVVRSYMDRTAEAAGTVTMPQDIVEMLRRIDGICKSTIHKVTTIEKTVAGIVASDEIVASQPKPVVNRARLRSSREIWKACGLPHFRGASRWFANRLEEVGCPSNGETKGREFDAAFAKRWAKGEGKAAIKAYLLICSGQSTLRFLNGRKHDGTLQ